MITDSEFNFLAQINHILFGAIMVFAPLALGSTHLWWFVVATVIGTAVKEFWYDKNYETPEARGSSLEDFLFYQLGMAVALGAYYLVHS